jgi:catechol 2,3-dioxygenase-like lactoylglutathione lyase family enzyme
MRDVMTDASFGLRLIGQIRIQVTDVDRAVAFYRDVLGMTFLYAFPGMGFFDLDGVRLMLVEPEGRAFGGVSAIYYRVDDIGEAVKTLESRGVIFDDQPHVVHEDDAYDLWMAFFRDPDGNVLALMSEVPRE